jgi:2-hydroxychromene-2-carboxylate isomerase
MKRLIFYYDVVCPYAYLASTRIEALARRAGIELEWEPILLGGVYRALGSPDRPSSAMPAAKMRLGALDLQRFAALYGVPLSFPAEHPRRTVEAMRLCHAVSGPDRVRLTHALYRAYFREHRDISDRAVLADICESLGLPRALAEARLDDADLKDALRAATDRAVADGVFGVPGMVIVRGESRTLFWGQDRLHLVEAALSDGARPTLLPALAPSRPGGELDFFYDFSSPYAYLASTQIERVAEARGAQVRFRPFLLGALFKAIGTPVVPIQAASEPKRRYLARDATDWASWWKVPFSWPSRFPMRTVLPLRLVLAVDEPLRPALTHAIFRAYWSSDRDISDPSVLAELVKEVGADPAALARAESDPAPKAALFSATDEAVKLGICGAPTFVVRGQLFWGQDRLELVDRALAGWEPPGL